MTHYNKAKKCGDDVYPDDYKSDFVIVEEEFDNAGNCVSAHLKTKKYAYKCEHCGSDEIRYMGWRKKEGFRDVTKTGSNVLLTIELRRYRCKNCESMSKHKSNSASENGESTVQSTYTVGSLPPCATPKAKISASVVDEIINLIAAERISINEAAKKLGVAPSSVSEVLKRRRERALKAIKSYQKPDILVIYPFFYGNRERCAIIGIYDKYPLLFDILQDCEKETIEKTLVSRDVNAGKIWDLSATLTDFPRPRIHEFLTTRYKQDETGILRDCVLNEVVKLRKKNYSRDLLALIDDALDYVGTILGMHAYDPIREEYMSTEEVYRKLPNSKSDDDKCCDDGELEEKAYESFEVMFKNWWCSLPKKVQNRLDGFHKKVEKYYDEITMGFIVLTPEQSPTKLLRFISTCKANKIPFSSLLSWVALVAGVYNRENVSAAQLLSSGFSLQNIHDFYIDLDELNAILDK